MHIFITEKEGEKGAAQGRAPRTALQLIRGGQAVERPRGAASLRVFLASLHSPSAKLTMRVCLRRVARLLLGADSEEAVEWGTIRYYHVELLKEQMTELKKRDGRPRYQPATINVTLSAVKGVAREAWRLGDEGMSVEDYQRIASVRGVPATRDRRGRALSADELTRLLKACERDRTAAGPRDACLLALMCRGGLRREEAVAARLSDFNTRGHALKVRGKGDRERTVYFRRGGARRALLAWLRVRGPKPGALLCPVDKKGRIEVRGISGAAVYKALAKRARQAGLRPVTPHDLRRTLATELLEHGSDLSVVQRVLGHASVETTTIYDCRGESAKREALDSLSLDYRRPRAAARSGGKRPRKNHKKQL